MKHLGVQSNLVTHLGGIGSVRIKRIVDLEKMKGLSFPRDKANNCP